MRLMKSTLISRRAFTLIELLVVLVIIGVLAALVVPGGQKAIARARAGQCMSNLRQIGIAFQVYLGENNNRLPQRVYGEEFGYDDLILPDAGARKKIFVCPAHRTPGYPYEPSYGMNWYYDNSNSLIVRKPSTTVLVAETLGDSDQGSHRADRDSVSPGQLDTERHAGKSHYLFFDGHMESLRFEETITPVDRWGEDQGVHDEPPPGTEGEAASP